LRDIVERLDAMGLGRGEVRIVGGGARDNLWATIKASVLGRPVRRVLTEEATAVGAAMVAGVGIGFFADFAAASVAVRLAPAAIDPDSEATKAYADAYRRYLVAFDAVESALASSPVLSAQPTSPVLSAQPTSHSPARPT
jgi:xylulokinase